MQSVLLVAVPSPLVKAEIGSPRWAMCSLWGHQSIPVNCEESEESHVVFVASPTGSCQRGRI